MNSVSQDQILDKAIFISLCADALGKGMNPSFPFQQWVNNDIFYSCMQRRRGEKVEE